MDATGAIADAACESGSLTSAQFVTPMSGATVTGWLRALPSSSRYVVGHHKSSDTSLGTLFDNVVSAASFPHFSESIMQIA